MPYGSRPLRVKLWTQLGSAAQNSAPFRPRAAASSPPPPPVSVSNIAIVCPFGEIPFPDYKDLPHLPLDERAKQNFDHPDSIDTPLLIEHVRRLREGHPIERPLYDFTQHRRLPQKLRVEPRPALILEGILIFENKALRELMDIKIFVDTDADLRFIRRLQRDIRERGRTVESVVQQYLTTVRPMHTEFIEPSKRYADVIIPEGGYNEVGIDLVIQKIRSLVPR